MGFIAPPASRIFKQSFFMRDAIVLSYGFFAKNKAGRTKVRPALFFVTGLLNRNCLHPVNNGHRGLDFPPNRYTFPPNRFTLPKRFLHAARSMPISSSTDYHILRLLSIRTEKAARKCVPLFLDRRTIYFALALLRAMRVKITHASERLMLSFGR